MQLLGSNAKLPQTGVDPEHAVSLVQLLAAELAAMQTSGAFAAHRWTHLPVPHDPQLPPSEQSVVLVVAVVVVWVVVVVLVVVTQSTSFWQLPHAVQQRW